MTFRSGDRHRRSGYTVEDLYVFDDADLKATQKNLNLDDRVVDLRTLAKCNKTVIEATDVLQAAGMSYDVVGTLEDDEAEAILEATDDLQADRI